MDSFVYIIRHPFGWRKVGFSNRPRGRLSYLQKQSGSPLHGEVIFKVPLDKARIVEQAAHAVLFNHRITNEWFTASSEDIEAAIVSVASNLGVPLERLAFPPQAPRRVRTPAATKADRDPITGERCPSHPGALLEDIIPATGKTKTEIARLLGISRQHLYDIIGEKKPVSPEVAVRLGKLFGDGAGVWVRMQGAYDTWQAEREIDVSGIPTLTASAA